MDEVNFNTIRDKISFELDAWDMAVIDGTRPQLEAEGQEKLRLVMDALAPRY